MKKPNLHSCHILEERGGARRFWRFEAKGDTVGLEAEKSGTTAEPLPVRWVAKDWRTLYQKKVNIAWLPADQIFLRVLQLPAADAAELQSMVEFQLEKISPLPTAQIVWSLEALPREQEKEQTVIVVIAPRSLIEENLGRLEGEGYYSDRLEIPILHQLLSTPMEGDGTWIFPERAEEKTLCLIAWKHGGALRQLQLLHLPASDDAPARLAEQLTKMAWAGEMEGWLSGPLRWHLVAEEAESARWKAGLEARLSEPVDTVFPAPPSVLAERSAVSAAAAEPHANLLPPEYSARYRQQLIDRLWMSGLGAAVVAYLVGIGIYFAALQVLKFQKGRVEDQVAALKTDFTNSVKLKEQIDVLQNQLELKYAALNTLRAASELLPPEMTISQLQLLNGRQVNLHGTATEGSVSEIANYSDRLRKIRYQDQPLFSKVETPAFERRGNQIAWRFNCILNRSEP